MGGKSSRIKWPGSKYIKNFNIENRLFKKLEQQEKTGWVEVSPRHPSTAKLFKEIEEKVQNVDEYKTNKKLIEASRNIKITGKGPEHKEELLAADKRPKKENEIDFTGEIKLDPEFEKYGYKCPSKIRPGFLTLRQFDEFVNQYKQKKSIEFINQFAANHKVDLTNLHILLEFYKPFVRMNTQGANSSKTETKQTPKQIESDSVNQIFPNLK